MTEVVLDKVTDVDALDVVATMLENADAPDDMNEIAEEMKPASPVPLAAEEVVCDETMTISLLDVTDGCTLVVD